VAWKSQRFIAGIGVCLPQRLSSAAQHQAEDRKILFAQRKSDARCCDIVTSLRNFTVSRRNFRSVLDARSQEENSQAAIVGTRLGGAMRHARIAISLLAAGLICAGGAAALGKPLHPIPPAPPPLPPAPAWTGSYVGVNFGYSWGHSRSDYSAISANNGFVPETTSDSVNMNGVIGGGQVGYNYQFSPNYVAGIEADFQGSGERGSGNPLVCMNPLACDFGNINDNYTEKLEWFGTVRGRLGVLATPNVLVYGTGGFAYGELHRNDNYNYSFTFFCSSGSTPNCTPQSNSMSAIKPGWTAGAGMEMKLWGNWSGRVEYLYMQLAGLGTSNFVLTSGNPSPIFLTTTSHNFTDNILRVGLNYALP
jgi:outer membrane immunogenic protein